MIVILKLFSSRCDVFLLIKSLRISANHVDPQLIVSSLSTRQSVEFASVLVDVKSSVLVWSDNSCPLSKIWTLRCRRSRNFTVLVSIFVSTFDPFWLDSIVHHAFDIMMLTWLRICGSRVRLHVVNISFRDLASAFFDHRLWKTHFEV